MCDTIDGELLICFRHDDRAAESLREQIAMGQVRGVSIIESIGDRLGKLGLSVRRNLTFRYYRLSVPPGLEGSKINLIYFFYRNSLIQMMAQGFMTATTHPDIFLNPGQQLQISAMPS